MVSLLTLEDIRARLDEKFENLEPDISGYRITMPGLSSSEIEEVESILGLKFPGSFETIISRYNFGNLTIDGVFFGNTGSFAEFLVRENGGYRGYPWWGSEQRPRQLLMIAGSDGYVILLDIETGQVSAYLRTASWLARAVVSINFKLFVCAVGTWYLQKDQIKDKFKLMHDIRKALGCVSQTGFWEEMTGAI